MLIKKKVKGPRPWEITPELKKKEKEVIQPYVDKLYKQLKEKNAFVFWSVAGDVNLRRFGEGEDVFSIKPLVRKNKRLWGKKLANVSINPLHKDKDKTSIQKKFNVWLVVRIEIWPVDNKGEIMMKRGSDTNVYALHWNTKDFAISRLTFKLLGQIVKAVGENIIGGSIFDGTPLRDLINILKDEGVDLSDYLIPLAGM